VTGIVQEFQFGMNWSTYSRYVGDVFGAPLAMEALITFFLESTFLGVWIFGWGRLKPRIHLATIYLVAAGSWLSAAFILMANSWMQHPVGYRIDPKTGYAHLHDIWAVLTNPIFLVTFPHTIIAAVLLAGVLLLGVSCWQLTHGDRSEMVRMSVRIGLVVTFVGAVGAGFSGHIQAQVMTQVQPMKMAAAEALWTTEKPACFSLFAIGDVTHHNNVFNLCVPHLLSVLATNDWNGRVQGVNNIQSQYARKYGPGGYAPNLAVTYWTFRLMVGIAFLLGLIAAVGLWLWRIGRIEDSPWFWRVGFWALPLPFLGNFFGWIFTEMGRQPWVVFGLLKTQNAVSPSVSVWMVGLSLVAYLLIYGILAGITAVLMARHVRRGYESDHGETDEGQQIALSLATVY